MREGGGGGGGGGGGQGKERKGACDGGDRGRVCV